MLPASERTINAFDHSLILDFRLPPEIGRDAINTDYIRIDSSSKAAVK